TVRQRRLVLVFDQQPVPALSIFAVSQNAHQNPTAVKLLAIEQEFQFSGPQVLRGRIALGGPIATVPQHDRAAAILSFGNGSFEITVVQRMVLHFHSKALVAGIERWTAGYGPGFERTIELEAKIIMKPSGRVLLDYEAQPLGWRNARSASGLRRSCE